MLQPANRHPQLVSDWVEVFAPIIWSACAPMTWPAAVAIDEMEFRFGRVGKPRGDKAFSVLAAIGYEAAQHSLGGRTWPRSRRSERRRRGVDDGSWAAWRADPGWVVGDGGAPLNRGRDLVEAEAATTSSADDLDGQPR